MSRSLVVSLPLVLLAFATREAAASPGDVDLPTVLAIGTTTYFMSSLIHEGLGHETGCLIGGGRPAGFSTANAACRGSEPQTVTRRWDTVGGATANFLVGSGAATTLLLAPPRGGNEYYFLWLTSVVNLLQAGGYLMVSPWVGAGDFATRDGGFLDGLHPSWAYQLGLSVGGLAMTGATVFLANALAEPLLGNDESGRKRRRLALTLPAYLVGSTLVSLSGLLNRAGPEFAVTAALSTFAGTVFLAYLPLFFSSDFFDPASRSTEEPLPMERSTPWLVAGTAVALAAVTVFGPGIGREYRPGHPLFGTALDY